MIALLLVPLYFLVGVGAIRALVVLWDIEIFYNDQYIMAAFAVLIWPVVAVLGLAYGIARVIGHLAIPRGRRLND